MPEIDLLAVDSGVDAGNSLDNDSDDDIESFETDLPLKLLLNGAGLLSAISSMGGDEQSNARRTASSSDCTRP